MARKKTYETVHSIQTDEEKLASTLRKIRRRLGETQMEFAARIGVDQSAISRHERGVRDPFRDRLFYEKVFSWSEGAEEQEPFTRVFGFMRMGPVKSVAAAKVERLEDRGWLHLIEQLADLALEGKEAPGELSAVIRYWRSAPADARARILTEAKLAEGRSRPAQRKRA